MIHWFYTFIISVFVIATLIQLGFVLFLRLRKQDKRSIKQELPNISIIICAKNEAANLKQFLPFALAQEYPKNLHEVIVVDDGSVDNTAEILSGFQKAYSHLQIITIAADTIKNLPGKKYALAQGIKAAKHDRMLLTDADCIPSSGGWLREMATVDADIVLGYGAYATHPGLLNKFIRWETAHTCMQYTSYALSGLTYMGVGRNLSYRRSLWTGLENDTTFQQTYSNTPSGDDDLLVARIAKGNHTSICLNHDAHTISVPQKTWATWWRQKIRHVSTGKYYPRKIKNFLGIYGLSHSLYWFLGIFLLVTILPNANFQTLDWLVLFLFVLRLMAYWINAANWYRQFNEKKLLLFYPLGDLGWALYNVFLSPYIFWKNRQAWK